MNWTVFSTEIWPWLWPSLTCACWFTLIWLFHRWMVVGREGSDQEDPVLKRVLGWLSVFLILIGPALWVSLTPMSEEYFSSRWSAIWPWLWPSFLLGMFIGIAVFATRGFVRGLPERNKLEQAVGEKTVRRIAYGVMCAAIVLAGVAWIRLVPAPTILVEVLEDDVLPWVTPTLLFIVWTAVGVYLSRRVLSWLSERAARTVTDFDDAIVAALRKPLWLIIVVSGVHLWSLFAPIPETLHASVRVITTAALVFFAVTLLDAFVQGWLSGRASRSRVLATSGGVLRTAARAIIYIIGLLMVLSSIGIDVTPLLASLGVGSLAIGLALKQTLEDFLAGLILAADQPVRIGDFVEFDNEHSGTILSIGWRATRLRTRQDTEVIVPNSKLASATLINRSLPSEETSFQVEVGVGYEDDLDSVRQVVLEVATDLQANHPSAVTSFKPGIVYSEFGDSSVTIKVWLRARSWIDHFQLQDAFIRALHARYTAGDLSIPFPIRTLDVPSGTSVGVTNQEPKPQASKGSS